MTENKTRLSRPLISLCAAGVMLAATLAFLPSIDLYFMQDDFAVTGQFFAENDTFTLPTRPNVDFPMEVLPFWSHLADCYLWGSNPVGHHLTNLLLHVLTTTLLFVLVLRLMKNNLSIAFFTALFFALCPLHENAVSWISGRTIQLAAVFLLIGTLVALRPVKSPITTSLCYIAALLSHPAAFTMPLLIIFLDTLGMRRSFLKRFVGVHLPLLILMVVWFGVVRATGHRIWRTEATLASLQPDMLLDTLTRLLVPLNEALTNPAKAPILKWIVFFVAIPVQVLLLILRKAPPPRIFYVGLGWFVLMMVPIVSSARLGHDLADSRLFYGVMAPLYLMCASLLFADTAVLRRRAPRPPGRGAMVRAVVSCLLFCLFLGVLLMKNRQAYAGADRLVRHVQTEAIHSASQRSGETLVFVMDPPAQYGGAPVFSTGFRQALRPPFLHDVKARQISVVRSQNTRPLIEHLKIKHSPLVVLWMNPFGLDPSGQFEAISPVFPADREYFSAFKLPGFAGRNLLSWTPMNGLTGSFSEEGYTGMARFEDPWFLSPPLVIPIQWVQHVEVRLGVKGEGDVPVDLFWGLLENPMRFSADRVSRKTLPGDGKVRTLLFPLKSSGIRADSPGDLLARLRLDPPGCEAIRIESIALIASPICPVPGQEVTWTGSELRKWRTASGTTAALEAGDLTLRTEGEDPYLVSPGLDITAAGILQLEIVMQVDSPNKQAVVYWATDKEPEFSEENTCRFLVITGDGTFRKYTLDFTGSRKLAPGTVLKSLRVDPMSGPGTSRIRSIRLFRAAGR